MIVPFGGAEHQGEDIRAGPVKPERALLRSAGLEPDLAEAVSIASEPSKARPSPLCEWQASERQKARQEFGSNISGPALVPRLDLVDSVLGKVTAKPPRRRRRHLSYPNFAI